MKNHLSHELKIQRQWRKEDAHTNKIKNEYDSNSQWGYIILVIAIIVFVCTFCVHGMQHPQFNPNGQPDTYRNCQTPFIR